MKEATLKQARKVLSLIADKEVPEEQLQKLLEAGLLADLLDANTEAVSREDFRRAIGLEPTNVFPVTVDYSRALAEMVSAGKYDGFNSDITAEHFPVQQGEGAAQTDARLFHFKKTMTSKEAIAEMDKVGYEPAKIEILLAFGEKYLNKQREFPVICLGSRWQDPISGVLVPVLDGGGFRRSLRLPCFKGGWDGYARFLAVRKHQ